MPEVCALLLVSDEVSVGGQMDAATQALVVALVLNDVGNHLQVGNSKCLNSSCIFPRFFLWWGMREQ